MGGRIPERKGRKSIGVDLIQPEIVRMASFSWVSNSRVYALCHQAWEQYSAGAYTKALVEVLSTLNEHPQVRPARRFIKAIRDETLFFNFRMWSLKVRLLSRMIPKYVGSLRKCRIFPGEDSSLS